MADQPDKVIDLTDMPLHSRSTVLTNAQDVAASKSATLFAESPGTVVRKTKAQKQYEYRQRIAASRTPAQAKAARKSDAERQRNCRLRKAANSALVSGPLESTTASSSRSGKLRPLTHPERQISAAGPAQITVQDGISIDQIEDQKAQSTWNTKWASSIMRFELTFLENDFGYACSVCDRLWFKNDLKPITAAQLEVISQWFIKENRELCREEYKTVCNTCKRSLNKKSMPPLAKVNGFTYPEQPPGLPPLDPISERLIAPRLPFMQVRRLRHDSSYGIIGQVINVGVDEQEIIKCLPRQLNEDDVINVNMERKLAHKSVYISGYTSKSTISAWLTELQKSPLYRLYEIDVDLSRLYLNVPHDIQDDPSNRIESISAESTPESEILASRQHTMMWNEDDYLNVARGRQATPVNVVYERHAEELSFPSIYFGEPRRFNIGVAVSPYMIANSEIRRRDRRGATPQKILFIAMKILRQRIVDGIHSAFRNGSATENVTRRMLEDTEFLKEHVIQNLAFMKAVPNSVQYWACRKRDLFAMIRQLGKPTVFLTIGANEIRWMKLLTILLKLSKKYPGKKAKDLNTLERCTLVSDDPVTCCIYFNKLVSSLMKMLKSKQSYNPFGKYSVKDYFLRIEFQHRGSPHARILLWLNDDPRETVSEHMPRTIDLVEKICSVARDDVPNKSIYANQIHKHSFTCTKRGETTCRFGMPYWPMPTTRVLVPILQSDARRQKLLQKAQELRTSLSERRYTSMDDFLDANGLTYASYLDIVRSTLRRPTLVFRRNFDELMTNMFNPYLAGEVNSNIDIQFILDEYSCAEYVVEFINKSARGMGDLRRELTTMMQEHAYQDYTGQLKALSIKLLNAVEMSAQEAAWYLLRQPMSETSRQIVYIPTVWPNERQRCRKRRLQMDREGIDGDSTDIWTKNIIQRYEERPPSLEQVYLAEFASWYANANDFVDEEDDVHVDDDEDSGAVSEPRTSRTPKEYRRRQLERVIRYRRYDINETVNYKREMVLLYVPFRNEMSDIVDQNKFLQLFDDNKDAIMERRSLFETNLKIENVAKVLEPMINLKNDDNSNLHEGELGAALVKQLGVDGAEKVDDVNQIGPRQGISTMKKRSDVTTKQQYCEFLRTTDPEQREIILEVVHRLRSCEDDVSESLESSNTFKCLSEPHNSYTQEQNLTNNAYIDCASTVNAAVEKDPKLPLLHQSGDFKDPLTEIKIKEKVYNQEISEDIQSNDKELPTKSECTQSMANKKMEYQIEDAHVQEIKQEVSCDFNDNQDMSKVDYPKLPLHNPLHQIIVSKDHLTKTNIKEEVCDQEMIEDIQSHEEELHFKSEYTQSIIDDEMEHEIEGARNILEIKQEVPCEFSDFDENQKMPNLDYPKIDSRYIDQDKISGDNVTHINIKVEECYEEGNDDFLENADRQVQLEPELGKTKENVVDNVNYTTDRDVKDNGESKLLVPGIKVSDVYDHVLEINPFEHANIKGNQGVLTQDESDIDSEYERLSPGPSTQNKLRMEIMHKNYLPTYSSQVFKPNETQSTDNESRGSPLQMIGDAVIQHDGIQMVADDENPNIIRVKKPRKSTRVRSNRPAKTSAERGREFRARKALLKRQKDAITATEDNQVPGLSEKRIIEKRAKSAEATRRWREKKRGHKSKKQAKTAAQRMREYRERKNCTGTSLSDVEKCKNDDESKIEGALEINGGSQSAGNGRPSRRHPKLPLHQSRVSKDHLTETNIKEEVCDQEMSEGIQSHEEELHSNTEHILEMGYQTEDAHILEIKQEVSCDYSDFDSAQIMHKTDYPKTDSRYKEQHNRTSDDNVAHINIKVEECNEEGNEDFEENANLQVLAPEHGKTKENIVDNVNYTTDRYVVNEKGESKLYVPEIKVSDVYDHVLEINPFEYANIRDNHSLTQDDPTTSKSPKDQATPKKNKTPAERSREYRARKKARQSAASQEPTTSNTPETSQENSSSEISQDSDGCPHTRVKKRKTPADYSREYRARKKALKLLQKNSEPEDKASDAIKPKTAAERSRDYRARKKAYMDLEDPIPIAPCVEMIVSDKTCIVDNHSILPDIDDIHDMPGVGGSHANDDTEGFSDSREDLHHMLHSYISNKFSDEILPNMKAEIREELNGDNQTNVNECLQIKKEYIQSLDKQTVYQINDERNKIVNIEKYRIDSVNENDESECGASQTIVNNVYDHILEIKQEIPCEFNDFNTKSKVIGSNAMNDDTNEKSLE